jgi:phenylalanyl-tRNA synthetase alpha subunit
MIVVSKQKKMSIAITMGEIMNTEECKATHNVEHTKSRISNLFTQCLNDMEKTASAAGLTMRDIGVDVEQYVLSGNTCVVELRLQL